MATYKKACSVCGELIPGDAQFCPFCANNDPLVKRCARCRNPVEEGWKVCSSCGLRLRTVCIHCGQEIPTAYRCIQCGAQVLVQCPNKKCNEIQLLTKEARCMKCGRNLNYPNEQEDFTMAMQSFTRNYHDESSENGFSFEFNCDCCNDGCKTSFVECKSVRKGGFLRALSEGIGTGARMVGLHDIAYGLERGGDLLTRNFEGMSPEWHKEHEVAFRNAMNEAKEQFHRCHGCNSYVCDACFNEEEGLCVNCAPRENTAVSKARSRRRVDEINEMADTANVFKGNIDSRQIVCPKCGKPVGQGKFCGNCGASVGLLLCPRCGAENQQGTKFCSECGQKLGGKPKCPSCGTENEVGAKFCCDCGTKM